MENIIGFGKTIPLSKTDTEQEYIIYSAIKTKAGIFTGLSHIDAMDNCSQTLGKVLPFEDGFITTKLRFINREIAFNLAKTNGQFRYSYETCKDRLYSENLFNNKDL